MLLSSLPVLPRLALISAVAWLLYLNLRQLRRCAAFRIVRGEYLRVADACGEWNVLSAVRIGPALWLAWRGESGRDSHLMLLADCFADPADWRLLNVWSRHRLAAATD